MGEGGLLGKAEENEGAGRFTGGEGFARSDAKTSRHFPQRLVLRCEGMWTQINNHCHEWTGLHHGLPWKRDGSTLSVSTTLTCGKQRKVFTSWCLRMNLTWQTCSAMLPDRWVCDYAAKMWSNNCGVFSFANILIKYPCKPKKWHLTLQDHRDSWWRDRQSQFIFCRTNTRWEPSRNTAYELRDDVEGQVSRRGLLCCLIPFNFS